MARPQEQPARPGIATGRRTLHHSNRLRHVRQKGKNYFSFGKSNNLNLKPKSVTGSDKLSQKATTGLLSHSTRHPGAFKELRVFAKATVVG